MLSSVLTYWFYPNPGGASYNAPKVIALLALCSLLILGSFLVSLWRSRLENPLTRKLSHSWPATMRWLGGTGLVLVVSRVEEVQFLGMRVLWGIWALAAAVMLAVQLRLFRLRHYSVIEKHTGEDPRSKYLPRRKRRR